MYSRIGPSNPWVQVTSPGWLEACQSERCPHDRIHLSRSIELRFRFKSDTSVKLRFFKHVSLWYCQLRVVVSSQPLMWPLPKISKCEVQVLPATSSSLPLDEEIPAVSYPKNRDESWYHVVICGKNEHSMPRMHRQIIKMIRWIGFPVYYQPKTCL